MNLPEYRRALLSAMENHNDQIDKANMQFKARVNEINQEFFSDVEADVAPREARYSGEV